MGTKGCGRWPRYERLCEVFKERVEISVDTHSGEELMELRIAAGTTVLHRRPLDSINDVDQAAQDILRSANR